MATIKSTEEKAKAYDEAIKVAQRFYNNSVAITKKGLEDIFPELRKSEDERIREVLIKYFTLSDDNVDFQCCGVPYKEIVAWLEKKDRSSDQIHYWTEEEIEPIISDYLRGAEHYGGMIARLRCLKPKSLGKQGEQSKKHDVCDTCDEKDSCISPCCVKLVEEWSEEDEYHKRQILRILKDNGCSQTLQEKTEKWIEERLKSIRPQSQWKPSDEQMDVLDEVIRNSHLSTAEYNGLIALKEQLKAL